MENGTLVISLDFELLWGVFDKVDWREKKQYFQNTREVVPKILQLFQEYQISCTWATVGMLFNANWEEWNNNFPSILPEYENHKLSAYRYGKSIQRKETEELCFAPNLIKIIKETPMQEVATHTYSHYYCLEKAQTLESFRADLEMSINLARNKNIKIESLVFPRNQFNKEYLEVCKNFGITSVRTNPDNWYWKDTEKDSLQQKIFRTGDAYFGMKDKSYSLSEVSHHNDLVQQKASRFLRPREANFKNKLKLSRIFSEIEFAAKNKEIYHLWWHPHNFGNDPKGNMTDLRSILDHYKICKDLYGMESKNMSEITKLVFDFN